MKGEELKMISCNWRACNPPMDLPLDEIHVWLVALGGRSRDRHTLQSVTVGGDPEKNDLVGSFAQDRHALLSTLSDNERARASRFVFEKDRNTFIMARGSLRILLGNYLNAPPASLEFLNNPYGKPALAGKPDEGGICFNVSHSGDFALLAFARDREIGVDIEKVRTVENADRIAQSHFSASEFNTYLSLPAVQRQEGFFNCWTRKEAFIKAKGMGLSLPLSSFDVTLKPGEAAAISNTRPDPTEARQWFLVNLKPHSSYAAALVATRPECPIECLRLT